VLAHNFLTADTASVLNGRVDELVLYKRLLTAGERAWL